MSNTTIIIFNLIFSLNKFFKVQLITFSNCNKKLEKWSYFNYIILKFGNKPDDARDASIIKNKTIIFFVL